VHLLTAQLAYAPTHDDDVLERCVTCYNSPYQMRPAQRVVCNVLNCVLRFVQHQPNIRTSISHYICLIAAQYQLDSSCICMYTHTCSLAATPQHSARPCYWSLFQCFCSWFAVALQILNVCTACVAVHTSRTQTLLSNIFAIAAEFVIEFHFKTLHH
jgi:hypothetical protein